LTFRLLEWETYHVFEHGIASARELDGSTEKRGVKRTKETVREINLEG
jgi:hypothetical protein